MLAFSNWDFFSPPEFVGLANFRWLTRLALAGAVPGWLYGAALGAGILALVALFVRSKPAPGQSRGYRALKWFCSVVLVCVAAFFIAAAEPANPRFWQSIYNTLFLMLGLPLCMAGSLFLAVLLNRKIFANQFFRLVYFLPSIVGGVGIYLLWKWIFNPEYGALNGLLALAGIVGPEWLESTAWAKPALILMNFWGAVGGTNMILYLAALQNIDPQLYEAAEMDGAGGWHRFRHIIVPMVSSTSFFIFVMGIIHGFQGGFDAAYVMTRGGPAGSTTTLSYYIYEQGFQYFEMGRASAASWILFLMVLAFTWLNWRFAAAKVHYA